LTEYSRKYEPLVKSFLPLSQSPAFNAVIRERLATWKKRGREGGERERERERERGKDILTGGRKRERERERERESGGGERGGGRDGKRSLVKVVGG